MREILFRGKRTDTGEWVEGYYTLYNDNRGMKSAIITGTDKMCFIPVEIVPETLGQYIGLQDKNGKKIFEGDVIKSCESGDVYSVRYCADDNYPAFDTVPAVTYIECNGLSFLVNVDRIEVIGNIHDNPELMKGE